MITSSATTGTHEAVIHEPHVMDRSPRYSAASLADSRLNGVPVSTSAELAALDWYWESVRKRPRDARGSTVRVVSVAVVSDAEGATADVVSSDGLESEEEEGAVGAGGMALMGGPAMEAMSGANTAPRADLLGTAHDSSVSPSTCHHSIVSAERRAESASHSTRAIHANYVGRRA